MSTSATPSVRYDPVTDEIREDPFPTFRELRDHAPVYYNADRDMWVLTRFEDVRAAAIDWETFSSAKGVTIIRDPVTGEFSSAPGGPGDFLEMDPPRHTHLRQIARTFFTPPALERLEPVVQEIVDDLIDGFIGSGEADLATDFGCKFPSQTVTHMLGFPREDRDQLSAWFHRVTDPPSDGVTQDDIVEAGGKMYTYLKSALDERRESPRGDMLSEVANAEIDGEPIGDEGIGMCFFIYAAGDDTVQNHFTTMIHEIARRPELREYLLEDQSHIPEVIEEFLRYDGPLIHLTRVTTREVTIRGVTIPEGARVVLAWSAAGRDERQFENPDTLKFDRKNIPHHITFGAGIHRCLGAPLARLESKIALNALLERLPDYTLAGPARRPNKVFMRGYSELPATFTPGRARR